MASPASTQQFLASLSLGDFEPLLSATRQPCPKCKASRKLFCYDCYLPVGLPDGALPTVALPIHVDIVKHPGELQSKSTAVHARLLAPENVSIYTYPDIPEIEDPSTTFLAFPSPDAVSVADIDPAKLKSIIFVDSTWFQAKGIVRDERLAHLRKVRLDNINTAFWRVQKNKPHTHLATVEAIYHFFHQAFPVFVPGTAYDGRYDNLLFLFAFNYHVIQDFYRERQLGAVKSLRLNRAGYIDYKASEDDAGEEAKEEAAEQPDDDHE